MSSQRKVAGKGLLVGVLVLLVAALLYVNNRRPKFADFRPHRITALEFSPSGESLFVCGSDSRPGVRSFVATLDPKSLAILESFPVLDSESPAKLTPDNQQILTCPDRSTRGQFRFHKLPTGEPGRVYRFSGTMEHAVFSSDGKYLLCNMWTEFRNDLCQFFVSGDNLKLVGTYRIDNLDAVRAISIAPNSKTVAIASITGQVMVFNAGAKNKLARFDIGFGYESKNEGQVRAVRFTPDSKALIFAREKYWCIRDFKNRELYRASFGPRMIQDLETSRDGKLIAVSDMAGRVVVYDASGRKLKTLHVPSSYFTTLEFSGDGRKIAGATPAGLVFVLPLDQ